MSPSTCSIPLDYCVLIAEGLLRQGPSGLAGADVGWGCPVRICDGRLGDGLVSQLWHC